MVLDWSHKKNLAKMGYQFNPDTLTDFEVSCYSIISSRMEELEIEKLKRESTQGRK
jgi:hypothetical protein